MGAPRQQEHVRAFAKSIVVSAIVFALELVLVAVMDRANTPAQISFAAVQVAGTCLGFTLNKYWAFGAAHSARTGVEGAKSLLVFSGSFVLNVVLPSCAMYAWNVPAVVAFTGSQLLVGLAWNFPLNRWWVFVVPVRS